MGQRVAMLQVVLTLVTATAFGEDLSLVEGVYEINQRCTEYDPDEGILREKVSDLPAELAIENGIVSMYLEGFRGLTLVGKVIQDGTSPGQGALILSSCGAGEGPTDDLWAWSLSVKQSRLETERPKVSLRGSSVEFYEQLYGGAALCKVTGKLVEARDVVAAECGSAATGTE